MGRLKRYRKRPDQAVTAVRLLLTTEGFHYHKWGAQQHCKAGDWIVDNQGDIYSVDHHSFQRSYSEVAPGRYLKITPVWAAQADQPGRVATQEGETHYQAGDYIVANHPVGSDRYAVDAAKFTATYQLDE